MIKDDELTPQEKFELYYEEYEKEKNKKNKPKDFIYKATTDYEKFKVNRALDFLEKKVPEFNSYINRVQITICLAFNTMYKNFPEENWKENRPLLNTLVETFKQRESFIDTEGK